MDEMGYVVGGVTAEGYLTLRRVGATAMSPLYDQFLEGQRVTVFGRRGPVPGVVGVRSTHLTRGRAGGPDDPFSLDQAYVDVGAASAAEVARLGVAALAPVTRAKQPHAYGPLGGLLAAPWAGQRAACAALLSAALRAAPAAGTTVVAFTRRRHFAQDGLAFLLRAYPGADAVVLGLTSAAALGSGPSASNDSAGGRLTAQWHLPAAWARTPVETVALGDVRTLEAQLARFLGGER
jgi:endoglucanase